MFKLNSVCLPILFLLFQNYLAFKFTKFQALKTRHQGLLYPKFSSIFGAPDKMSTSVIDICIPWEDLDNLLRSKEEGIERDSFNNQKIGRGPTNHAASIRLFDAPDGFDPEVTLYRDQAAWCPYCEKVWLQLEEKRIPYRVEKAPLRCYGEKPRSFLQVSPNGMLPVANIRGKIISESNVIMQVLEDDFPDYKPLLPTKEDPEKAQRVAPLLRLERQVES